RRPANTAVMFSLPLLVTEPPGPSEPGLLRFSGVPGREEQGRCQMPGITPGVCPRTRPAGQTSDAAGKPLERHLRAELELPLLVAPRAREARVEEVLGLGEHLGAHVAAGHEAGVAAVHVDHPAEPAGVAVDPQGP